MGAESEVNKMEIIPPNTDLYIDRSDETEKLYALERKRNDAIMDGAREHSRILVRFGVKKEMPDFWAEAMPQALFDTLNSFQTDVALAAAKAFVEYTEAKLTSIKSML